MDCEIKSHIGWLERGEQSLPYKSVETLRVNLKGKVQKKKSASGGVEWSGSGLMERSNILAWITVFHLLTSPFNIPKDSYSKHNFETFIEGRSR